MNINALQSLQPVHRLSTLVSQTEGDFAKSLKIAEEQAPETLSHPPYTDVIAIQKKLAQVDPDSKEGKTLDPQLNHIAQAEQLLLKATARRNDKLQMALEIQHLREQLRRTTAWSADHRAILAQIKGLENQAATKIQRAFRSSLNKPPLSIEQKGQIRHEFKTARAQEKYIATHFKVGENEQLADGFTLNSTRIPSKNKERTVVDRQRDPVLAAFIQTGKQRLEKGLESAPFSSDPKHTFESEMQFLTNLTQVILEPTQKFRPPIVNADFFDKLPHLAPYVSPQFKEYGAKIPLGTTIESGVSLCRHKALLTKVLIDEFGKTHSVKASFQQGFVPVGETPHSILNAHNEVAPWHGPRGGHAWNHIHFTKTGHEFIFDAQQNKFYNLSLPHQKQFTDVFYQQGLPSE